MTTFLEPGTTAIDGDADTGPLVRFHHVFKVYRIVDQGVVALAGVDFHIDPGEYVAVVGPSGSGKSTVLNLIGGLDRSSAGEVEVEGRDLARLDDDELTAYRREKVGFVWQGTARNLVPYLSVGANVGLPLVATGKGGRVRRRRVAELLEAVGLADRAGHTPGMLSGGEQQRVAVAVALANLPPILLADEPTAELDTESAGRVLTALEDVNREFGTTVVMVTHDLLAARRTQRIIRIRDGRIAPETLEAEPLSAQGEVALPEPAAAVLAGAELEVDVADGEVRIRRRPETRERRRPPTAGTGPVAAAEADAVLERPLTPEELSEPSPPEPEPEVAHQPEPEVADEADVEPEVADEADVEPEVATGADEGAGDETGPDADTEPPGRDDDEDPYAEFRRPT